MDVMYIACNNCLERGYFLGDVLTVIKVAWLFVENERPSSVLLSLHADDPLVFLWSHFVSSNRVQVVYDAWEKGNREAQFAVFEERRASRHVRCHAFTCYKELYPRLDGGDRQRHLCGEEQGLGRSNIFEYYYFGQESPVGSPLGSNHFGRGVIESPICSGPTGQSVLIAPHEKCQGNRVFTHAFWRIVVLGLLSEEVDVTLNDDRGFLSDVAHPRLHRSFLPFRSLVDQVADARLVVCGNTGIGWLAAAVGTPFIALEHHSMILGEYSYSKCGCSSLKYTLDEPNPEKAIAAILSELRGPR